MCLNFLRISSKSYVGPFLLHRKRALCWCCHGEEMCRRCRPWVPKAKIPFSREVCCIQFQLFVGAFIGDSAIGWRKDHQESDGGNEPTTATTWTCRRMTPWFVSWCWSGFWPSRERIKSSSSLTFSSVLLCSTLLHPSCVAQNVMYVFLLSLLSKCGTSIDQVSDRTVRLVAFAG